MNSIISITGPSGVGKSTISKIISICLGHKDSLIVSGDDSHLWERGDENWKFFTHLNPEANNLSKEYEQINNLKKNRQIERRRYNHSSGKFSEADAVLPRKNIVYEGLHTMYGQLSDLADISFYVETEKSLSNEWKISRDSIKRGYSIDKVIKTIDSRKNDERKFIVPQKDKCDVVLKFKKTSEGNINLSFDYTDPKLTSLINKIKKLYSLLEDFVSTSKKISMNPHLSQNKGGNLSFRFDDVIAITESGSSFDKISYFDGFGFYDLNGISIFENQKTPSMEIKCHLKLGACCLHTHPLHVMPILCSVECEKILNEVFSDFSIMEYFSPGKSISDNIQYHKNIFLKNHGMFISRHSLLECFEDSLNFDLQCRKYLESCIKSKTFLFPDAFVIEDENKFYHSYVKDMIMSSGLTPQPLTLLELKVLDEMEEEKYRKNIK